MKKISYFTIVFSITFIFNVFNANAQCPSNNTTDVCSGGNGIIHSSTNINSGDKYWWNSGSVTVSSVNFGGGTLVVCGGTLTITSGHLNSGTIIVMGGTLNMNFNCNISTLTIVNYSTINFNGRITLQGNPTQIFNNGGNITVLGKTTINGTSQIINNGTFETNELVIQTNNGITALCQGLNATTNVSSNFTNNSLNSIQSPSGTSCIYVGNDITLNKNVSPDSDLHVCDAPGGNDNGSANWGSATVFNNCNVCSVVLPIELLNFDEVLENDIVKIYWSTASEINSDYFSIERSKDGINFEQIGRMQGGENSSSVLNYVFYDENPYHELSYYRIKQIDFNGAYSYSDIKTIYLAPSFSLINIYPNPAKSSINILVGTPKDMMVNVVVFNNIGQKVINYTTEVITGRHTININTSNLSSGSYIFKITTPNGVHVEKQFIKK